MPDSSCVRFGLKGRSEQRQVRGEDRQIGQDDIMRSSYRQMAQWRCITRIQIMDDVWSRYVRFHAGIQM